MFGSWFDGLAWIGGDELEYGDVFGVAGRMGLGGTGWY